jgi:manganese transport protein
MRYSASHLRTRSLAEINASVGTTHASLWRRLLAFAGPAYLVSVGYMDPGNWVTDLEGGSRFGYRLLWVLVMSNAMAILLQTLSARLGVVSGRDLAQACREAYPRPVSHALWVLCEIAIAACDLAEVLGAAIGLHLLFGIPLLAGVLVTSADTLILLGLQQFRIRSLEMIVVRLIVVIGACLGMELFLAKPDVGGLLAGVVPQLDRSSLFATIAILGATVMPHNLYLHSALVQSRRIGTSVEAKRRACRYNLVDTMVALNAAMLVNIAILVLAAAVFFRNGIPVTEIQQATTMLEPLLGTKAATVIFAVGLLCAGQASTLTGTMAGQIVMEGFLNFRMSAWLRRLVTRLLAIVPAAITVYFAGDKGAYQLLLVTQAVLSLQLPFAVIPLIRLTADRRRMGEFASRAWLHGLAWLVAGINLILILWLARLKLVEWLALEGVYATAIRVTAFCLLAGLFWLLLFIALAPMRGATKPGSASAEAEAPLEPLVFMDTVDGGQQMIDRLDVFMTHLHGIAFIKDPVGRYAYVSGASSALWGLDPESILSKPDDEIWPPELAKAHQRHDEIVYQHLKTFEGIEIIPQNGVPHSWLIYKFPIVERATQAVFLGGVGVDITDRQRSEEQLRGLAARLQAMREQERALTSREVHDIGQLLTALELHLSMMAGRLSAGADPASMAGSLAAASDLLTSTIETSARVSSELRSSVLDNLGLADAIGWQAREFSSRTGIQVFTEPLDKTPVEPDVRILVFRIFQDILANIQRHARATEVRISLGAEGDSLVLRVRDNGRGITLAQIADAKSLGLVEMRELALSFGGRLEIEGMPATDGMSGTDGMPGADGMPGTDGMPGQGTTVSVAIPLDAQASGINANANPAA